MYKSPRSKSPAVVVEGGSRMEEEAEAEEDLEEVISE